MSEKYFPQDESIVVIKLSEAGKEHFKCTDSQEIIYYIKKVEEVKKENGTILLGEFMIEFENSPNKMELSHEKINRVFYQHDKRVFYNGYRHPTETEISNFISTVEKIRDQNPEYKVYADMIINSIS